MLANGSSNIYCLIWVNENSYKIYIVIWKTYWIFSETQLEMNSFYNTIVCTMIWNQSWQFFNYFDSCPGGSSPKTACPGGKFVGTTGSGQLSNCNVRSMQYCTPPPLTNFHYTQIHTNIHTILASSILLAEALRSFDWFTLHRTYM